MKVTQEEIYNELSKSMATEYAKYLSDDILGDVNSDLETSAGEEPNESDIRLSIGRVLLARMGVFV